MNGSVIEYLKTCSNITDWILCSGSHVIQSAEGGVLKSVDLHDVQEYLSGKPGVHESGIKLLDITYAIVNSAELDTTILMPRKSDITPHPKARTVIIKILPQGYVIAAFNVVPQKALYLLDCAPVLTSVEVCWNYLIRFSSKFYINDMWHLLDLDKRWSRNVVWETDDISLTCVCDEDNDVEELSVREMGDNIRTSETTPALFWKRILEKLRRLSRFTRLIPPPKPSAIIHYKSRVSVVGAKHHIRNRSGATEEEHVRKSIRRHKYQNNRLLTRAMQDKLKQKSPKPNNRNVVWKIKRTKQRSDARDKKYECAFFEQPWTTQQPKRTPISSRPRVTPPVVSKAKPFVWRRNPHRRSQSRENRLNRTVVRRL